MHEERIAFLKMCKSKIEVETMGMVLLRMVDKPIKSINHRFNKPYIFL